MRPTTTEAHGIRPERTSPQGIRWAQLTPSPGSSASVHDHPVERLTRGARLLTDVCGHRRTKIGQLAVRLLDALTLGAPRVRVHVGCHLLA